MLKPLMNKIRRLSRPKVKKQNQDFEIYEEGKNVDHAKVVLFFNDDDVERCKLEEEIRSLDREIAEINARLEPWEQEMRQKHRDLWNY